MKNKILTLMILSLLFLMPVLYGQEEFGFTGEVQEIVLKQLTEKAAADIQKNFPNPLMVEPMMIGFSKLKPTDTDFECFSFIDYYWDGSTSKNYLALIVANYGNTPASGTIITMDIKGPKNTKYQINRTIPRMTVMLYIFTFNLGDEVGMYEMTGMITSPKIFCSSVKTRFYIEEIW